MFDLIIVRIIFVLVLSGCAYLLNPFQFHPGFAALIGLLFGGAIILFEIRLEKVTLKRLIGAACGSVLGIIGAFLMSLVLNNAGTKPLLQVTVLMLMTYVGLVVGAKKGDMLNLSALGGIFGGEKSPKKDA